MTSCTSYTLKCVYNVQQPVVHVVHRCMYNPTSRHYAKFQLYTEKACTTSACTTDLQVYTKRKTGDKEMQKGKIYQSTDDYLNSIHDIVANGGCWNDYKCNCYNMEPMKFITKSNVTRVAMVCVVCGRREMNGVKKADFPNFDDLPTYDMEWIKDEAHARHQSGFNMAMSKESRERNIFWDVYPEYLSSDKWKTKSRKVIARDKVCQSCNKFPATQAHHLTYKHVFNEPLFDLIGVCKQCHEIITDMDRQRALISRREVSIMYRDGELLL